MPEAAEGESRATCSLSAVLTSCLFSSPKQESERSCPKHTHASTHTLTHAHTYSFVTTGGTCTMCRAGGCCHPWLEHRFPARRASSSTASLFQPPPLHLPANLIKMVLGSAAALAWLFHIPANIHDFSFKIFRGDNKEES